MVRVSIARLCRETQRVTLAASTGWLVLIYSNRVSADYLSSSMLQHLQLDHLQNASSLTKCAAFLQRPPETRPRRTSYVDAIWTLAKAKERLEKLDCWMQLCYTLRGTRPMQLLMEACATGLGLWEWPANRQQGLELVRKINASSDHGDGASKHVFPTIWHQPTGQASAPVARKVVLKFQVEHWLKYCSGLGNSCGEQALRQEIQFYRKLSFWMDAAFMEFLRGLPGVPTLLGAVIDPDFSFHGHPIYMVENLGDVTLSSPAYTRLAQTHARELALAMMRTFQGLCDGGAFQLDEGSEQYLVTQRPTDGHIEFWVIDNPHFFVGPVTELQRKYRIPQETADGKQCSSSFKAGAFLPCHPASGFMLFPAQNCPPARYQHCMAAALSATCCASGGEHDAHATAACASHATAEMPVLAGVSGVDFAALRARFQESESGHEAMCRQTIVRLTVGVAVGMPYLLPALARQDRVVESVREALLERLLVSALADSNGDAVNEATSALSITNKVLPPDLERMLRRSATGGHRHRRMRFLEAAPDHR
uniref:Uncharacterized protein n=1 Tax=Chrysotila carterae TaxID=13221 RepID=A0A7S4EVY3_CHRCT